MTYNSLLFSFIVIQRMEEGRAKVTDENFALFKNAFLSTCLFPLLLWVIQLYQISGPHLFLVTARV